MLSLIYFINRVPKTSPFYTPATVDDGNIVVNRRVRENNYIVVNSGLRAVVQQADEIVVSWLDEHC